MEIYVEGNSKEKKTRTAIKELEEREQKTKNKLTIEKSEQKTENMGKGKKEKRLKRLLKLF